MSDWKLEFENHECWIYSCEIDCGAKIYVDINADYGLVTLYSEAEGKDGNFYAIPKIKLFPKEIEFIAQKTKELLNG